MGREGGAGVSGASPTLFSTRVDFSSRGGRQHASENILDGVPDSPVHLHPRCPRRRPGTSAMVLAMRVLTAPFPLPEEAYFVGFVILFFVHLIFCKGWICGGSGYWARRFCAMVWFCGAVLLCGSVLCDAVCRLLPWTELSHSAEYQGVINCDTKSLNSLALRFVFLCRPMTPFPSDPS